MKRVIWVFLIVVCLPFSSVLAEDIDYQPTEFSALVSNVRLQGDLIEKGYENEDTVSVTANAYLLPSPLIMENVNLVEKSYGRELDFLVEYTKANIEGDAEKIVSFWYPGERDAISNMVSKPDLLAKNTAYFKSNPNVVFVGIVDQGETRAILQKRSSWVMGLNIKEKDGRPYLTNKPADDLELAIIEASFVSE